MGWFTAVASAPPVPILRPSGHPYGRHDLQATKLTLTAWFLAFYLNGHAKTGISSLELSRHLGVKYDTAWLLHHKILRAMAEREEVFLLREMIQMDDAYLGGERPGGKAGRGSENKIPIVAAVSWNEADHPIHARIAALIGFSSEAIADWVRRHLAPGSQVLSDGLACFRAVTTANCHHKAVVTGGNHPNDLPQFRWINTLLGNLKTSFSGTLHAFNFGKYARRYPGGCCMPCTERNLRGAEVYGQSSHLMCGDADTLLRFLRDCRS